MGLALKRTKGPCLDERNSASYLKLLCLCNKLGGTIVGTRRVRTIKIRAIVQRSKRVVGIELSGKIKKRRSRDDERTIRTAHEVVSRHKFVYDFDCATFLGSLTLASQIGRLPTNR